EARSVERNLRPPLGDLQTKAAIDQLRAYAQWLRGDDVGTLWNILADPEIRESWSDLEDARTAKDTNQRVANKAEELAKWLERQKTESLVLGKERFAHLVDIEGAVSIDALKRLCQDDLAANLAEYQSYARFSPRRLSMSNYIATARQFAEEARQ